MPEGTAPGRAFAVLVAIAIIAGIAFAGWLFGALTAPPA